MFSTYIASLNIAIFLVVVYHIFFNICAESLETVRLCLTFNEWRGISQQNWDTKYNAFREHSRLWNKLLTMLAHFQTLQST